MRRSLLIHNGLGILLASCTIFLLQSSAIAQTFSNQTQSLAAWSELVFAQKLDSSFGLQIDFQYRRRSQWLGTMPSNNSPFHFPLQLVLRPWLHWQAAPSFRVSASPLGYWRNYNINSGGTVLIRHELRNSVQGLHEFRVKKSVFINRLRFECRYFSLNKSSGENTVKLGGSYFPLEPFSFRVRYMFRWLRPLGWNNGDGWYLALSDEIFMNLGKNVATENRWDQNRALIALGHKLNSKLKLETGYLNQTILRKSDPQLNHALFLILIFENGSSGKLPDPSAGLD